MNKAEYIRCWIDNSEYYEEDAMEYWANPQVFLSLKMIKVGASWIAKVFLQEEHPDSQRSRSADSP